MLPLRVQMFDYDEEEAYLVNTEEVDEEKVWYNAIMSLKHRQREAYLQDVYW